MLMDTVAWVSFSSRQAAPFVSRPYLTRLPAARSQVLSPGVLDAAIRAFVAGVLMGAVLIELDHVPDLTFDFRGPTARNPRHITHTLAALGTVTIAAFEPKRSAAQRFRGRRSASRHSSCREGRRQ